MASGLERDPDELRTQLLEYILRRECYRVAWAEANRLDGVVPVEDSRRGPPPATSPERSKAIGEVEWDAGAIACGELALGLRARLSPLPPGTVIRIRATDPAAPEDVPAWCRLTGHSLESASPPEYRIRRKGA